MGVLEHLDYQGELTSQNPQAKYRVLNAASGTYLCSCVVEGRVIEFDVDGQRIEAGGFAVDHVTYYLEMDQADEARYVVAVLNAPFVDQVIKPMQARGAWGGRHIHKKILELPIPRFDPARDAHRELAALGRACTQKVADVLSVLAGSGDLPRRPRWRWGAGSIAPPG